MAFSFGFFYWFHYNSLILENWYYYLPILNYAIIFLSNSEICHALGQPKPWDHLQAYVAYGENRMDRIALVQTGQMARSACRLHSSLTLNLLLARSSSKNPKWRQQLGWQWFPTAAHQTKRTRTMLGLEEARWREQLWAWARWRAVAEGGSNPYKTASISMCLWSVSRASNRAPWISGS